MVCKLPHELPNDLRLTIVGNKEIFGKFQISNELITKTNVREANGRYSYKQVLWNSKMSKVYLRYLPSKWEILSLFSMQIFNENIFFNFGRGFCGSFSLQLLAKKKKKFTEFYFHFYELKKHVSAFKNLISNWKY